MPNWCSYTMKAVSKDKKALDRLISIMSYNDKEYYIYRCSSVHVADEYTVGDYFVVMLDGDVAWSCSRWFDSCEIINETNGASEAHYISIDLLCARLGIGVEVFSEEPGMQFQEHYLCHATGEIVDNECVPWTSSWFDDDGNDVDEPIESGGFDYYCDFDSPLRIYGE